MNNRESLQAMAMIGSSYTTPTSVTNQSQKFVCQMYGFPKLEEVDECRYSLFCTKNKQSHNLPPCQDALMKHTQRANFQAAIWRRALEQDPDVPSPDGYGWTISDNCINIDWMSLPPAPEALLDLVICGCTGFCSTRHCSCHRSGLSCTDSCQCGDNCGNPHTSWENDEPDDDSDIDQ